MSARPAVVAVCAAASVTVAVAVAGCTPAAQRSGVHRSSSQVVVVSDGGTVENRARRTTARTASGSAGTPVRTVVVTAAGDVCWTARVDGRQRSGCGDARLSDTRGAAGASVTKTGGPTRVGVRLVVDGRTVDRGSVWRTGRTATVG